MTLKIYKNNFLNEHEKKNFTFYTFELPAILNIHEHTHIHSPYIYIYIYI